MNPFKNTITHLYSSDVTKNKKDKHIFSAAKKQFQTRKTCKKQQNLRFYRNGKVRSNISYEYANDLARGNILCNNCDKPTDTCGDIYVNSKNKVAMHNNAFSQFIGGGVIVPEANYNGGQFEIDITQKQLVPIIQSDVSGSWGGINEPSKANITVCGPSGNITCLYPLPDVIYNNGIPWMDIHIEVTKIGDEELLNKFIKFKPSYRGPNWRTDPIGKFAGPYSWDSFSPWALVTYKDTGVAGGTLSNVAGSLTPEGFFNDVNFIIGDCKSNLTQSNNKRNTYMYCLEDGTKKINFTKENPVNLG